MVYVWAKHELPNYVKKKKPKDGVENQTKEVPDVKEQENQASEIYRFKTAEDICITDCFWILPSFENFEQRLCLFFTQLFDVLCKSFTSFKNPFLRGHLKYQ